MLAKHQGPGAHPNGTPQSVHGGGAFHGTVIERIADIVKTGLQPRRDQEGNFPAHDGDTPEEMEVRKNSIYLTPDLETAEEYGRTVADIQWYRQAQADIHNVPDSPTEIVVFEVEVEPDQLVRDEKDARGYRLAGGVPPEKIVGYTIFDYSTWPPKTEQVRLRKAVTYFVPVVFKAEHKPGSAPAPHLKKLLSKGANMKLTKHPGNHDQKVHAGKVRELGAQIRADGQKGGPTVQAAATERARRLQNLLRAMEAGDQAEGNRAWNSLPEADRQRLRDLNGHFQKEHIMSLRQQVMQSLEKHYGPGPHPNGTEQGVHASGGEGPSPNDLKAKAQAQSASGRNPQAYDVDYDSGEPSLAGAKAFIQDLQTSMDGVFQAARLDTGKGDSETPADVEWTNAAKLGQALRDQIHKLGIDPDSLSDFDEFVAQVFPWEKGVNVGWEGSRRSQENYWEPEGGEPILNYAYLDDHADEIKANIAEYIQVQLDENEGPTFDQAEDRSGLDVTRDGLPGGRAVNAQFDRLSKHPGWNETVYFNKPGTSLYRAGKLVPSKTEAGKRPWRFKPEGGDKVEQVFADQIYRKKDEPTSKSLREAVVTALSKRR